MNGGQPVYVIETRNLPLFLEYEVSGQRTDIKSPDKAHLFSATNTEWLFDCQHFWACLFLKLKEDFDKPKVLSQSQSQNKNKTSGLYFQNLNCWSTLEYPNNVFEPDPNLKNSPEDPKKVKNDY